MARKALKYVVRKALKDVPNKGPKHVARKVQKHEVKKFRTLVARQTQRYLHLECGSASLLKGFFSLHEDIKDSLTW